MARFSLFGRHSFIAGSLICCMVAQTGCGGGGGGSDDSGYSGTWDYRTTQVADPCRLSIGQTFNGTMSVTQVGSNVTVRGGSLTLTGKTNDEDGFSATMTRPATDGCTQAMVVKFRDASDGEALVGIAIGAECRGRTCAVAYGGIATRTGSKSLEGSEPNDIAESTISTITSGLQEGDVGAEGGIQNGLEEALMQLEEQR